MDPQHWPKGYVFFQATPHGQILPIAAKILKQDTLAQPGAFEDFVKGRTYVIKHTLSHFNSKMFQKQCSGYGFLIFFTNLDLDLDASIISQQKIKITLRLYSFLTS
jgi:hypothetical protein